MIIISNDIDDGDNIDRDLNTELKHLIMMNVLIINMMPKIVCTI